MILGFMMKKFLILCFIILVFTGQVFAKGFVKIEPEFLQPQQSKSYKEVNETLAIIFSKIKPVVRTSKYPKYYNNFTLVKDDGTQNKAYYYVKNIGAELIYDAVNNELKFISFRRPELEKCRILYDYPSGNLYAVQVFVSDKESYVFGADGKYVDYAPYVKEVREKVYKSWQMPSRKQIETLAKNEKDLLVQVAVTINKDGTIKNSRVLKSSKIKELDNNALNTVKNSAPFKAFPDNFFNPELVIILNFNFSL